MSKTPETDKVAGMEGNWDTKALRMTHAAREFEKERNQLLTLIRLHCDLYDQLCEQEEPSDALHGIFDRFKRTLPENKIS